VLATETEELNIKNLPPLFLASIFAALTAPNSLLESLQLLLLKRVGMVSKS